MVGGTNGFSNNNHLRCSLRLFRGIRLSHRRSQGCRHRILRAEREIQNDGGGNVWKWSGGDAFLQRASVIIKNGYPRDTC